MEGRPPPNISAPPRVILSLGADAGCPPKQGAGVPGAGLSRPRSPERGSRAPHSRYHAAPPHSHCRAPTCLPTPGRVQWEEGDPRSQERMGGSEGGGSQLRARELQAGDLEEGFGGPGGSQPPSPGLRDAMERRPAFCRRHLRSGRVRMEAEAPLRAPAPHPRPAPAPRAGDTHRLSQPPPARSRSVPLPPRALRSAPLAPAMGVVMRSSAPRCFINPALVG